MINRRQLLVGSIATAGIGGAATAVARTEGDGELIAATLAVEEVVLFAYRYVLGSARLSAASGRVVVQLYAQERQHAGLLTAQLRHLGGPIPAGPSTVSAADKALAARHATHSLAVIHDEHGALDALLSVEAVAEGAYFTAISKLSEPVLLRLCAQIMGNEAQHASALGDLRYRGDITRAIPDAFVEGKHEPLAP
jgi:hypothetical protein